ncbi:MAG: DNA polymerase III subunit delta [Candidatus Omnitrophota bacterium]|jgi:DNA polymerase-3 subunit delta
MVNSKPSVYLFTGSNDYLKKREIDDLKSSLLKNSPGDTDYKMFRIGEDELSEILDYVNTIPFLSSRKLVVVKNAEDMKDAEVSRLAEYIKRPSKFTYLVLDLRDNNFAENHPEVADHSVVKRFNDLAPAQFRVWVQQFVSSRTLGKIKIEDAAVSELAGLHGGNLTLLAGELEKLIAFVGNGPEIKLSDIEEVAGRSLAASAFDLTWAIENSKVDEALSIISDLVRTGKKHYEIIGLLCWHLRRILRAKMMEAKGKTAPYIANILRIGRRYQEEFFKQAGTLKTADVNNKLAILLEADMDIKRTKFDPTLVLEFVVIKLCLG